MLAAMVNYGETNVPLILRVVSNVTGRVSIFSPTAGLNHTYAVAPEITEISLNPNVRSNIVGQSDKGVVLKSDVDIAVFVFDMPKFFALSESYLVLPVNEISNTYVVQSYEPRTDSKNQFIAVASEDSTTINITLKTTGSFAYANKQYVSGDKINVTLNNLQTFHLFHNHDLSGTLIESDKPVAVFSGGDCIIIPTDSNSCDIIASQLVPVLHWAFRFIVPPIYPLSQYFVRITAFYNESVVRLTNSSSYTVTLYKGEFWDSFLSNKPVVIEGNKAITVALHCPSNEFNSVIDSDPFMLLVPGVSQFALQPFVFPTMVQRYSGRFNNYVSIVIEKALKNKLLYNGSLLHILREYPVPRPFDQYIVAVGKLGNETAHIISTGSTSAAFGVFVYGLGPYEGYGFVAGMRFDNQTGL